MNSVNVSTFICDRRKDLEYVMADGLRLCSWTEIKNLRDIFNDKSLGKLQLLFDTCDSDRAVMNWELWPMMPIPYNKVYCSVLSWLRLVIIRISDQPLESFFYDLEVNENKSASIFFPVPEGEVADGSNFSRLNNELASLQRSLQRKNIKVEELNERLEVLATIDALTGLFNRRAVLERAETELARTKRTKDYFGIAIVDIDDMQKINEQYGEAVGDQCLIELARTLNISTRSYDGAGRIGGDEFLIYFAMKSKIQFRPVLERVHERISKIEIKVDDDQTIPVKASIGAVGLAAAKYPNIKVSELLVQAFEAVYQSKELGKFQVILNAYED
ncbi:MAG: GGDEF domain-containing protein [Anaerolineaceae bacterium]|nr:GGDEF domain-containing protein [Anaerolineaceae bacterium]